MLSLSLNLSLSLSAIMVNAEASVIVSCTTAQSDCEFWLVREGIDSVGCKNSEHPNFLFGFKYAL